MNIGEFNNVEGRRLGQQRRYQIEDEPTLVRPASLKMLHFAMSN
jgi:hypothetical protein